jgi:hypothetical protein
MRISQDTDSWKASGILRRDFRHTHNGPEVDRHKGQRKKTKVRKHIGHKHVFVDVTGTAEEPYWGWLFRYSNSDYFRRRRSRRVLRCAEDGCDKVEYRQP